MAMLRLASANRGPAKWVIASGDLTARTAPMIEDAVAAALDDKTVSVVVDLREVSTADSSVVDALVAASKLCSDRGVAMRLCVDGSLTATLESAQTVAL